MTHLPVFPTQTTLGEIRALPSGKHTQPSTDVPTGLDSSTATQVLRGQDFTLRRDSGAEGGVGALAEGGSTHSADMYQGPTVDQASPAAQC